MVGVTSLRSAIAVAVASTSAAVVVSASSSSTLTTRNEFVRRAQDQPGTACPTPGESCAYAYDGVLVQAYCSPSGFCADNGAFCTAQEECYNFCGTDNTCGGSGAYCSSRSTDYQDVLGATCYTPQYSCSTNAPGGRCVLNPSAAAGADARRKRALLARGQSSSSRSEAYSNSTPPDSRSEPASRVSEGEAGGGGGPQARHKRRQPQHQQHRQQQHRVKRSEWQKKSIIERLQFASGFVAQPGDEVVDL